LSAINSLKRVCMTKSQMKTVLITFFNIKGIVHFDLILQNHTVNKTYYVEILEQLCEVVHCDKPEL
jgi:hypothetical protein